MGFDGLWVETIDEILVFSPMYNVSATVTRFHCRHTWIVAGLWVQHVHTLRLSCKMKERLFRHYVTSWQNCAGGGCGEALERT